MGIGNPKVNWLYQRLLSPTDKLLINYPIGSHKIMDAIKRVARSNIRVFWIRVKNTMEVSAITGHKTLSMLKRYTHLKATDLALKLG